ncbi:PREDICTED: receptor like protein 30 [Camelina sativa]|uniref:Receptor like protein 30 n=1 Tax=Camelina sativa TaxID=90675 RepID=A0ABM0XN18_CAMSA|nr:PREDICTED: receptor like protein 30 [Camelina sativa]
MNLGSNDLRGNIPTSFTNLTKLSDLRLDRNQFTGGDIVLANLTSLNYVVLFSNYFKSSLSSTNLSGLHNLKHFDGSDNSFMGPFPSSLLMVSSLEYIGLSQNKFEGPIDFRNSSSLSKLKRLDVSQNDFNGLIPESLSKLVNLHDLDLSHNNFGGHFPRVISKLVHLDRLDLSHNNFVGQVPRSISKLVSLSSLDFSYNKLEGHVPHFIWRSSESVSQLYVDLSHNSFASFGESVEKITDGASLNWLHLASNSLQGPIPQWICKLQSLGTLDLSNNNLTGSIPQCLKNSTYLQELNLQNNSLSGVLPDFNGSVLRSLDVSRNNLVGNLPKSLINCNSLEFLNVKRNKINGTFPFWLGSLESLYVLVLRSNALHGPVYDPSAYLGFPSLRIIDISNNNFVGSLPQDYFANWTEMSLVWAGYGDSDMDYIGYDNGFNSIDLVYKGIDTGFARIDQGFKLIDFSGNRFSGHIPGSIGLLSELRLLNLSGNGFTGNIPPTLENITKLETLDLSRNNLSGEIPQGLGKLSFLSNINFSYNHLEGLLPQSTQFGSQNCSSFVGNPGLHGFDESCGESYHVPSPTTSQPLEEPLSEPEEPVLKWIAAAIAFAPGVFCGLVIGHIFTSYKYEWFIAR